MLAGTIHRMCFFVAFQVADPGRCPKGFLGSWCLVPMMLVNLDGAVSEVLASKYISTLCKCWTTSVYMYPLHLQNLRYRALSMGETCGRAHFEKPMESWTLMVS